MQLGQTVKLRAYGGEIIERRLVGIQGGVLVVCKDEEYVEAQKNRREPMSVGFRREYLVED